jgi:sarcosine/dimethylglycine N-methyltransferase
MIESASFAVDHWNDLTDQATALMRAVMARPPDPLGLHAFVPNFAAKAGNLTRALASGRLHVIQAIAVAA